MYTLYYQPGTRTTAAELVLEEAGLVYETKNVDITKNEHLDVDYLAINPRGTVPALVAEGRTIACETIAIMLYLCDHHDLAHLAPSPRDDNRGPLIDWLTYHATEVQEPVKRYFYAHRHAADDAGIEGVRRQARRLFNARWRLVDNHLRDNGPYHLGEQFSIVDLYLLVTGSFSFSMEDGDYPAIRRCTELVAQRPKVSPLYDRHLDGLRQIEKAGVPD